MRIQGQISKYSELRGYWLLTTNIKGIAVNEDEVRFEPKVSMGAKGTAYKRLEKKGY